jgi:hypothetical protein
VYFDLWAEGQSKRFAWTDSAFHNAWLALDRNGNGTIDNGSELFGSSTPQPVPPSGVLPNGFNALAVYDLPENRGNGDGVITSADGIFSKLLLWIDENHDGISQSSELHSLASLHVDSISLDYVESKRTDRFGNKFLYRARIRDAVSRSRFIDRFAWDVYLTSE